MCPIAMIVMIITGWRINSKLIILIFQMIILIEARKYEEESRFNPEGNAVIRFN